MHDKKKAQHAYSILLTTSWVNSIQFHVCYYCVGIQQSSWTCSLTALLPTVGSVWSSEIVTAELFMEYHFHFTFLTVTGGAMFVFSIKLNRISNPSVQKIMHLLILGVWKCGPTTESDVCLVWKVWSFILQLLHPTMAVCTRSSKVCGKSQITESICTVMAADAKSTEPPNISH